MRWGQYYYITFYWHFLGRCRWRMWRIYKTIPGFKWWLVLLLSLLLSILNQVSWHFTSPIFLWLGHPDNFQKIILLRIKMTRLYKLRASINHQPSSYNYIAWSNFLNTFQDSHSMTRKMCQQHFIKTRWELTFRKQENSFTTVNLNPSIDYTPHQDCAISTDFHGNYLVTRWVSALALLCYVPKVGFTLPVVYEFHVFLIQFSNNFHEILHTLFSINVVTTLKILHIENIAKYVLNWLNKFIDMQCNK